MEGVNLNKEDKYVIQNEITSTDFSKLFLRLITTPYFPMSFLSLSLFPLSLSLSLQTKSPPFFTHASHMPFGYTKVMMNNFFFLLNLNQWFKYYIKAQGKGIYGESSS